MLVIMAGLPATGKTTIARGVATAFGAVHLRIDTIEQAVVRSGAAAHPHLGPIGYEIAYALATDHLRQGLAVVADSVNPLVLTRTAWRDVATRAGSDFLDLEVVCSDPVEHERRSVERVCDIPGLRQPTWQEICQRRYEPWDRDRVVVDTAGTDVAASIAECVDRLRPVWPGQR